MAKGANDFILRDRLQITLDGSGDSDTKYGRMDLSDFVNTQEKKGIKIKEIYLQVRDPNNAGLGSTNTGIWNPAMGLTEAGTPGEASLSYKMVATTRAYESLRDVGIGSPDVLYCLDQIWTFNQSATAGSGQLDFRWSEWPTRDLHPEGYTVVSDLLIGVAVDEYANAGIEDAKWHDAVLEIDIMLIAQKVTVTQKMLTNLLTQAQDV